VAKRAVAAWGGEGVSQEWDATRESRDVIREVKQCALTAIGVVALRMMAVRALIGCVT